MTDKMWPDVTIVLTGETVRRLFELEAMGARWQAEHGGTPPPRGRLVEVAIERLHNRAQAAFHAGRPVGPLLDPADAEAELKRAETALAEIEMAERNGKLDS